MIPSKLESSRSRGSQWWSWQSKVKGLRTEKDAGVSPEDQRPENFEVLITEFWAELSLLSLEQEG